MVHPLSAARVVHVILGCVAQLESANVPLVTLAPIVPQVSVL